MSGRDVCWSVRGVQANLAGALGEELGERAFAWW